METKCEVVGWLHVEADAAQVLVREVDGHISLQAASSESAFGQYAIQTGRFPAYRPVIDPVTRETLGYELARV